MGISKHEARALIRLYKTAGSFGRVATLGRQTLYVRPAHVQIMLRDIDKALQPSQINASASYPCADEFLRLLGASEVVSFDASDYEGASVTHDMNLPIPGTFHGKFDLVYDGGTLEHVFNFPQAVKNCMDLLKVSGRFVCATPANNFMGHGLYQFSPELFFRLFSRENGFRIEQVLAFEYETGGQWFEVEDPRQLGRRAELWGTGSRIVLWIVARRIEAVSKAQLSWPQQSDYVSQWKSAGGGVPTGSSRFSEVRRALRRYLDQSFPGAGDAFRGFKERRRLRRANRHGLRLDQEGFKRVS